MKVKNQTKSVVFSGELSMSVAERKTSIAALGTVINAIKTKEIVVPDDQLKVITDLRDCVMILRPADADK